MKILGAILASLLLVLSPAQTSPGAGIIKSASAACTCCNCGGSGCCVAPAPTTPPPSPPASLPPSATAPHDLQWLPVTVFLLPPLREAQVPPAAPPPTALGLASAPLFARHCAFLI